MRALLFAVLGLALALVVGAQAADKDKEETLKGTLVCGKCTLKETKACCNVLQVKDGDKTVNYFLKDKGKDEKYHGDVCPKDSKKEGVSVTGTVSEKDGKKWIISPKIKD